MELNKRIIDILHKCANKEPLTDLEQEQLDDWINASPYNKEIYDDVSNQIMLEKDIKQMAAYDSTALWNKVRAGLEQKPRPGKLMFFFRSPLGRVAAVLLIGLVGTGIYFGLTRSSTIREGSVATNNKATVTDLAPGKEGALLQLADGSTIELDDMANGQLLSQGDVTIVKQDGQVIYTQSLLADQPVNGFNTITTQRGKKYRLALSDGSVAWLNAASSIRYPPAFAGDTRNVEITGEVYFEVAKNKKPFRVKTRNMEVEVLGTHFNINAYDDEKTVKTTLLEGLVKVHQGPDNKFLKPAQQATVTDNSIVIGAADTEQVMAWKNNNFYFQDDNIETIMRQIARWYDVDIEFRGQVNSRYTGIISRDKPVSAIFQFLEMSGGVHVELDAAGGGKRIIVKP